MATKNRKTKRTNCVELYLFFSPYMSLMSIFGALNTPSDGHRYHWFLTIPVPALHCVIRPLAYLWKALGYISNRNHHQGFTKTRTEDHLVFYRIVLISVCRKVSRWFAWWLTTVWPGSDLRHLRNPPSHHHHRRHAPPWEIQRRQSVKIARSLYCRL